MSDPHGPAQGGGASLDRLLRDLARSPAATSGEVERLQEPSASRSAASPALLGLKPGDRIDDRFEIAAALGAGAMGEGYPAHGTRLGRDVAIKVLAPNARLDPERIRRFEHEARAVGSLNHPGLVALFDVGL